jgi:hypothetical protein
MRAALALVACALFVASAARGELYKCQGPDGRTLFTSDRSQCPGASAHEPSGALQRTEPSGPARAPSALRPPRPAALQDESEGEAEAWRAKRAAAESALRETELRLATAHQMAGWCNRGHEVWAEDRDGLRRDVDCEEVEATERALRREQARLEAYLAEGLEEECRRSGCLPGWIR